MTYPEFRTYAKDVLKETLSPTEASERWRAARAAVGKSPSKTQKRRDRAAKLNAAKRDERDEVKNNEAFAGETAAVSWNTLSEEDREGIVDALRNEPDSEFSKAFKSKVNSLWEKEFGSEEEEAKEEEAKEDPPRAKEGGEEAKEGGDSEAKEEKSDLTRTKPMDDDERKNALRFILGKYADRDSLVDDMGLPLGKEHLLTLAKLTPIWSALSDQQKQMFLSETGTFASGNQYVATAKVARKAPVRKTIVQSSSGKRMAL